MNELKDYLKRKDLMTKRSSEIKKPAAYVWASGRNSKGHLITRQIQKIFTKYIKKAGLDEVYAYDSQGRALHKYTVHSLRHSHIRYYIHYKKLDVVSVQQQVGHQSLETTLLYTRLRDDDVKRAYDEVRREYLKPVLSENDF